MGSFRKLNPRMPKPHDHSSRKARVTFEESLCLTPLEKEVITLKAVLDMINNMVNHETMLFTFNDPDSSVMFKTMTHKAYFNILLVDLLSVPKAFFQDDKDYIERLNDICSAPLLSESTAAKNCDLLRKAAKDFSLWLSQDIVVEKRWFPLILDKEMDVQIQRKRLITVCGNINKHNFTQQTFQAKNFQNILKKSGKDISLDKCLTALEDFRTQFYDDIFSYHAATIAELLNNIRWGIYQYAVAARLRCVINWYDEKMQINSYRYEYPNGIASDIGKVCFWDLMNDVIRAPYIQKFEVTKWLKQRY